MLRARCCKAGVGSCPTRPDSSELTARAGGRGPPWRSHLPRPLASPAPVRAHLTRPLPCSWASRARRLDLPGQHRDVGRRPGPTRSLRLRRSPVARRLASSQSSSGGSGWSFSSASSGRWSRVGANGRPRSGSCGWSARRTPGSAGSRPPGPGPARGMSIHRRSSATVGSFLFAAASWRLKCVCQSSPGRSIARPSGPASAGWPPP